MVITHLDCCLCSTILMTIEIIIAITATANNVDKATITPLLSLMLSPSEQLQVTTEKVTVIGNYIQLATVARFARPQQRHKTSGGILGLAHRIQACNCCQY